jgi:hypothetical protein
VFFGLADLPGTLPRPHSEGAILAPETRRANDPIGVCSQDCSALI